MKIRVLGGGWYGCHIAAALLQDGHEVELHEISDRLFSGASGGNPARLHLGFHYPRSRLTRAACQEHHAKFMEKYGHLTRSVPVNIYAVAAQESMVDFGTYRQVLQGEVEFVTLDRPGEFGLCNIEGALLTGERHIVIDWARNEFMNKLSDVVIWNRQPGRLSDPHWDWTIDCTFCANGNAGVDRYEPCLTVLLNGPADTAITIMDGPFPSIYPWNEGRNLSSLTSALYTPFSKTCRTWGEAHELLNSVSAAEISARADSMLNQMAQYWPAVRDQYRIADHRLTIRAMPKSASDARLVDVVKADERVLRIRAGKIDAILYAEALVREAICSQ